MNDAQQSCISPYIACVVARKYNSFHIYAYIRYHQFATISTNHKNGILYPLQTPEWGKKKGKEKGEVLLEHAKSSRVFFWKNVFLRLRVWEGIVMS